MDDQVIKLTFRTDTAGATEARNAVVDLKEETYELEKESFKAHHVMTSGINEVDKAYDKLVADAVEATRAQKLMNQMLNETATASDKAATAIHSLSTSAVTVTGHGKEFNRNMLMMGQAVQDFQAAGFLGISNNLDRIALSLGLGSGVASAVMVAGAAFLAIKPLLKDFFDSINGGVSSADKINGSLEVFRDRLKELDGKEVKTYVDLVNIDKAKETIAEIERGLAAVRAAGEYQTEAEKASGKAVGETIGADKAAQDHIKELLFKDLMTTNPEMKASVERQKEAERRLAEAEARMPMNEAQMEAKNRQVAQQTANRDAELEAQRVLALKMREKGGYVDQEFGKVLAEAEKGRGGSQADAQRQLAELLRRIGAKGTAAEIESSSPDEMKIKGETEEQMKRKAERDKKAAEAAKKAAEDAKKAQEAKEAEETSVYDAENYEFQRKIDDYRQAIRNREAREKKQEADAKHAAAETKSAADKAAAEAKRKAAEAARPVTGEEIIERQEAQVIREMRPDATEGQVKTMAAVARELQQSGMNAWEARQRAINEMLASLSGMRNIFDMMRAQDQEFIARARTFLGRGG